MGKETAHGDGKFHFQTRGYISERYFKVNVQFCILAGALTHLCKKQMLEALTLVRERKIELQGKKRNERERNDLLRDDSVNVSKRIALPFQARFI